MKVYLSIVIPAHNSSLTIGALLLSIFAAKRQDIEIIISDDGSKDKTREIIEEYRKKNQKIKLIKLNKSKGPAYARNIGAKEARGEIILFLDSDVVVKAGTVKEVIDAFKEDKYRVAMTGVWDKKQVSGKLFPKFKALRDWSYWINEKKIDAYYYLFSTRIAAIKRDVFEKLGGFNENFRGADVEDIEFTYRIAKRYRVDFNEKMVVQHEFEGFFPIAKKYYKRSYQWVGLFLGRKKFDPVATTGGEALTSFSAVGITIFFILGLFYNYFFIAFFFFLLFHLWGVRKFLIFVFKEEGILFTIYAFFMGILLYHYIFAGAFIAVTNKFFED